MRTAAGYVVYARSDGRVHWLLLRNARHGTWSFPKGHLEEGEDLRDAARRELEEETGITAIEELSDFEVVVEYRVPAAGGKPSRMKRAHLFLARAASTEWTRSAEHDEGAWLTGEAALARLQHADLKDALLRAMAHVTAADPG